jgi:hypothetical protein
MQSKIPWNSAAFRDTEFRIIPRNFRQFRMAYGIYGSNKNVRNSGGHPTVYFSQISLFRTECVRPNFSVNLAENICQELAKLIEIPVSNVGAVINKIRGLF